MKLQSHYRPNPLSWAVGVALTALVPPTALAQSMALEEVVITARKQAESLQDVPMAVTALGGEQMQAAGIVNLEDMSGRIPGMSINIFSIAEPDIAMRGIGTDIESAGASGAIGVFVDEVYLSRGAGVTGDLFDLERVEVLRGPQGTLYGKNVVGGAISFITKKPSFDFDAMAELTLGAYNQTDARGFVNGALSENVAGRISYSSRSHDGYAKNLYTGNDMEDLNSDSLRGHLLWTPTENLEVLLSGDRFRSRSTARWRHIAHAAPGNRPFVNPDPRRGRSNIDGQEEADIDGLSLRIDWTGDNVTLSSLTAYRQAELLFYENSTSGFIDLFALNEGLTGAVNGWGFPIVDPNIFNPFDYIDDYYPQRKHEEADQFSQEFRASFDIAERVSVVTGVYFLREDISRKEFTDYYFHLREDGFNDATTVFNGQYASDTASMNKTYAAFGQAIWDIDDYWSLTLGLRYSYDEKDFKVSNRGQPLDGSSPVDFSAQDSESWDAVTPSVTINFKPTPDVLLYATYSEGYKSGGWNGESAHDEREATQVFDPEFAENIELGLKSQWWDNRIQLNIAAFHTLYLDQQSQQLDGVTASGLPNYVIVNGDVQADGAELEFAIRPVEGLTISGTYAYLDSRFKDDLEVDGDNLKGNVTARSPHNSTNIAVIYEWPMGGLGTANVRLDYRWQDELYMENNNNPLTRVGPQHTWDASVGLTSPDEKWALRLWGKNITDELNIASSSEFLGTTFVGWQPPRTWGATVTWRY